MLEGLRLLQRTSPTVVDQNLLRQNGIARGNEYKVIGALRFLGLIDDDGHQTDRARLLKARGPLLTLNLQKVVREAYPSMFRKLDLRSATRDDIYNHFLADLGLQPEMASKATRFFLELVRAAGFTVGSERPEGADERIEDVRRAAAEPSAAGRRPLRTPARAASADAASPTLSVVLPAESLSMSEDELTALFSRVLRAWRRAVA
jgi:hypothetical protein